MTTQHHLPHQLMQRGLLLRLAAYACILALLGNLNAMVDAALHPTIPYLDEEHLIVGGATGMVTALLLGLLELYLHRLSKTIDRLARLEKFLAICSFCKKVRLPGADPKDPEAWIPLEIYLYRRTATEFSHGLCPDCLASHYSEITLRPTT